MNMITTAKTGHTTVPLAAFDKATDALDKIEAILSTLSASFDDEHGFVQSERVVWLTVLAARDLVDEARASLTGPVPAAA